MDFVFSNPGQQALCDAGFEASSNTFTPGDGCQNTLKALYAAVRRAAHLHDPVHRAGGRAARRRSPLKFRQAFHQ